MRERADKNSCNITYSAEHYNCYGTQDRTLLYDLHSEADVYIMCKTVIMLHVRTTQVSEAIMLSRGVDVLKLPSSQDDRQMATSSNNKEHANCTAIFNSS